MSSRTFNFTVASSQTAMEQKAATLTTGQAVLVNDPAVTTTGSTTLNAFLPDTAGTANLRLLEAAPVNAPGTAASILYYASNACWDATNKRMLAIASTYSTLFATQAGKETSVLFSYSEATDTWAGVRGPQSATFGTTHAYSSNCIDPRAGRRKFWKSYHESNPYGVDEYDLDTLTRIRNIPYSLNGRTYTLTHVPDRGTAGVGSLLMVDQNRSAAYWYDLQSNSGWVLAYTFPLADQFVGALCCTHPISGTTILCGGTGSSSLTSLYQVSASGTFTKLTNLAFNVSTDPGSSRSYMTPHPSRDVMVLFHANGNIYEIACSTGAVTTVGTIPTVCRNTNGEAITDHTMVATNAALGVIAGVQRRASGQSRLWIYRPA